MEALIPFEVMPKQSARFRLVRGHVFSYQPVKLRQNAKKLKRKISIKAAGERYTGPVKLVARYVYPSRTGQPAYKHTRPDLDNLTKQLCDAIERSGVLENDSRIVRMELEKVWSTCTTPQCTFTLRKME